MLWKAADRISDMIGRIIQTTNPIAKANDQAISTLSDIKQTVDATYEPYIIRSARYEALGRTYVDANILNIAVTNISTHVERLKSLIKQLQLSATFLKPTVHDVIKDLQVLKAQVGTTIRREDGYFTLCDIQYTHNAILLELKDFHLCGHQLWNPINDDENKLYLKVLFYSDTINCFRFLGKHPHVSENIICLGEAKNMLTTALLNGSILDAIDIVFGILCTYNERSPYWRLGSDDGDDEDYCSSCDSNGTEWTGSCRRCDVTICDNCYAYCECCDRNYCTDCISSCHRCDIYLCTSCRSPYSDHWYCPTCFDIVAGDDDDE